MRIINALKKCSKLSDRVFVAACRIFLLAYTGFPINISGRYFNFNSFTFPTITEKIRHIFHSWESGVFFGKPCTSIHPYIPYLCIVLSFICRPLWPPPPPLMQYIWPRTCLQQINIQGFFPAQPSFLIVSDDREEIMYRVFIKYCVFSQRF